ncbi:MAG: hypothetical protein M9962_04825 [Oligoflexia bacterium]|nr:hypothetical protein [Oligoflexia bacterium]
MKSLFFSILIFTISFDAYSATKNILVTGYWPPTNKMLEELSPKNKNWAGKNWKNLGYDVYAYFPTNTENTKGVGEGDFRVDFASVFNDFMRITKELKPVAILSFGLGAGPWEIESVFPAYYHQWFLDGKIPSTVGVQNISVPESLKVNKERKSTLPLEDIQRAVEQLGDKGLRPWIDTSGGAGDYVCGFTGYIESWYQEMHSDINDPAHCKAAGFIHVSGTQEKAKASMEASLEALILSLSK